MQVGNVKKSIMINTDIDHAWNNLSKITSLNWLEGQKSTKYFSQKKRGVGAIRLISFNDGSIVKEHIVGWHPKKYFSYVATSGLPLNSYHATISINQVQNHIKITWESYFSSNKDKSDFNSFIIFLSDFYTTSLKNLKNLLES